MSTIWESVSKSEKYLGWYLFKNREEFTYCFKSCFTSISFFKSNSTSNSNSTENTGEYVSKVFLRHIIDVNNIIADIKLFSNKEIHGFEKF